MVTLVPSFNPKYYSKPFFWLFTAVIYSQSLNINYNYENISLQSAVYDLIDRYQLLIIFPDELNDEQPISAACNECSTDEALSLLLMQTDLTWKRSGDQYTIFKPSDPMRFSLAGCIVEKETGEKIPYANIFIPSLDIGGISNADGMFSLTGIPVKSCTLFVSYIGYSTGNEYIVFPKDDNRFFYIELSPKILYSKNILITGESREFMDTGNEPGKISFSPRHISTLPNLGEVDIFRSLQLIPGIHQGLGGTAGLHIRGGTPEQNLILLDGMPLYKDGHMFGFLSNTQTIAIKDIQVYKGGYPARYGGRISGLIELTSKVGNTVSPHIRAYSNLMINNVQAELPIFSRGSCIITARKGNNLVLSNLYQAIQDFVTGDDRFNLIGASANEDQDLNYTPQFSFEDITAVFSTLVSPKSRISFTYTVGSDSIKEDRTFWGFQNIFLYDTTRTVEETIWSNDGIALGWSYYWNPLWETQINISTSKNKNLYDIKQLATDSGTEMDIGSSNEKNIYTDKMIRLNQSSKALQRHHIELGFEESILTTNYNTIRISDTLNAEEHLNQTSYLHAMYIQDKWAPTSDWTLNAGFRATYYSELNNYYVSPRLSASFRINQALTLETSIGKYHQFLHQFNSPKSTRGSQNSWLLSTPLIPPISSVNMHTGVHWKLESYDFNMGIYLKQSGNLYDFQGFQSPVSLSLPYQNLSQNLPEEPIGKGETRGAEFFARRKSGKITGWISYQWNKTEYTFPILNGGKPFPADHDITHEFKNVVLTSLWKWNLAANWVYSSGRVYTDPKEIIISNNYQVLINSGMRNNKRLKPVHHLDVTLSRQWQINSVIIDTGISVYNLYNRENISHKRYNPYTTGSIVSNVIMLGITPTFFLQASI